MSPLTAGKPPLPVLFTCSVQRNRRSDEALLPGAEKITLLSSIGDPDPHVFGPPGSGSGSINQSSEVPYGSGSSSESGTFPFLIKVLSGLK